MDDLSPTVAELATRPGHEKVRVLIDRLLVDGLGIESRGIQYEERTIEVRGRIDALLGRSMFEFKTDLRAERDAAESQLTRYLGERESATGQRYVGVATDGATFIAYESDPHDRLRELARYTTSAEDARALLAWLQSVLAVGDELTPDPEMVRGELGRDSPAYHRAQGVLSALWDEVRDVPEVVVKRKLWGDYLEHVYGSRVEEDDLFIQHTYLTIIAKAMATSVLGIATTDARELLAGTPFTNAGIAGAVESDFFDWVLVASGGGELISRLIRHVGRFRLGDIRHDVLKGLYESLIDPEQRHDLGEYYTPDWLASAMCERAIDRPLVQHVLDPSCGSGTFLFHAVRRYLDAADAENIPNAQALAGCAENIAGIDVHPVAVVIARVTYLLALGEERLRSRPARLTVPVYLGDSLQWNTAGFFGRDEVRIKVPDGSELQFPAEIAADSARFDATVDAMVDYGEPPAAAVPAFRAWMRNNGITDGRHIDILERTYEELTTLRQAGRNHIWAYVLRNLSRPFALSAPERRADVVIGNPPWLSYRYMATAMQKRFRDECRSRNLWSGGKVATHQDISAYFFARMTELYLKKDGVIAFVMPYAALSRQQFKGFRTQRFGRADAQLVRFEEVWAFDENLQPLFPVPSCAIFARRGAVGERPGSIKAFTGTLPRRDASPEEARAALSQHNVEWPAEGEAPRTSAYERRFRQGATVVPRRLWVVERVSAGRFGANPGAPLVRSLTSRQEKAPWKDLSLLEGSIETEFLRRLYLGASIAPYRLLEPVEAVIPWDTESNSLLTADQARARGHPGLSKWLTEAEGVWNTYRRSEALSLLQRLDYHKELSTQLPTAPIRVLYTKSGTNPAACVLTDQEALVDHVLYWAPSGTIDEARYLTAFLNSEVLRQRIASRQSRGQWGARHIDKLLVRVPIPRFVAKDALHGELARFAERAEQVAAAVSFPAKLNFVTSRRRIRAALAEDGVADAIDRLVEKLLG
ncbi:MAG: N-6 DNA methylase [Alphaproteobacteria bacterium]